jgi:hypothetical protein
MDNIPPEKHPPKEPLAITGNLTIKNGGVRLRTAALFAVLAFAGGNYLATRIRRMTLTNRRQVPLFPLLN